MPQESIGKRWDDCVVESTVEGKAFCPGGGKSGGHCEEEDENTKRCIGEIFRGK